MNRTRYHCRNIDRDREHQRNVAPDVPLPCTHCDELLRTTIAEMMVLTKKEYTRGFYDGAASQAALVKLMLKGKEEV